MPEPSGSRSVSPPPDYQSPASADELVSRYNSGERYFWDVDIPERAVLSNVTLANAIFQGGWLSDLDFQRANLKGVTFLNCNLKCTDFRGAHLEGATFRGCSLEATDFKNASLTGASFAGAYMYSYGLNDTDMPGEDGQF